MTHAAAADTTPQETAELGEALCLPDTDWLQHRLTICGPAEEVGRFRTAAAGAGVIPRQLDFEQLREDWFHRLMEGPSCSLSAHGARILAQQMPDASEWRHALAVAQVGRSRACPFDLDALQPVPVSVLALGPDHPQALALLWQHWGITQALDVPQEREAIGAEQAVLRVGFWAADWTPWRVLMVTALDWPELRFETRPRYNRWHDRQRPAASHAGQLAQRLNRFDDSPPSGFGKVTQCLQAHR